MLLDPENNAYLAAGTMSEMAVTRVNSDGTSGWTQTVPFGYAQAIALASTDASIYVVGGTTARLVQAEVPGLPPAAPSALGAEMVSTSSVSLRWTDNSVDETGFTLERCTGTLQVCAGSGATWSVRSTTAAGVTTFADTGLPSGTTYSWRVKAFNIFGSSAWSNTLAATTLTTAPLAPSGLQAQAQRIKSGAQVSLTWLDKASNETGYTVERCRGSSCTNFTTIRSLAPDSRSYTDAAVSRRTDYRYRVMATGGSAGNSGYSNVAAVRTP
jgi:hypothetical protein